MSDEVKIAFEMKGVNLKVSQIRPTRQIGDTIRKSPKYASIKASIEEIGIIEPPIVYPTGNEEGRKTYLLLDGHIRLDILKSLGQTDVLCLVSTNDEGYTYNHKANRLSPIQEQSMIMEAIEHGVPEERIAKALCVDVARIKQKRNMTSGLCPEAAELLKDRQVPTEALAILKRVRPMRQIEMAELMISAKNFSKRYAQALLSATPVSALVAPEEAKPPKGISPEDLSRMKREMDALREKSRQIEKTYASNIMNLTLARGYLARLLENGKVFRHLSAQHPNILAEFNRILRHFIRRQVL